MTCSIIIALLLILPADDAARELPVSGDTREVILDMALESVQAQFDEGSFRFEISARWIPGSLLSTDPSAIQSVEMQGSLKKYTTFEVNYTRYNRAERAEIQLLIETEQYLPVPSQRIVSGTRLTGSLFDMRWVGTDPERDEVITTVEQLEGMTLRRTVLAGQAIVASSISAPLMVEAGEEVEMIYEGDGIDVIMTCEARQAGALTEEITVHCKETRRKYLARVTGQGEALWIRTL